MHIQDKPGVLLSKEKKKWEGGDQRGRLPALPQAAPTSMGYHSCDCTEEGFNIQQTGIEGDRMSASDVSSVPIVTNQSHPSSQISACTDPESSAAPSRARRASAASTSAFNLNVPPPCARAF